MSAQSSISVTRPTELTAPLALLRTLVACKSVTPTDDGALDVVQSAAEALGFACRRYPFGEGAARVDNLFAKRDTGVAGPHFAFAGHTDVVPPGDEAAWHSPPFNATEREGALYGRGVADMKGGIAAFLAAVARVRPARGAISLIITGDEEGPAVHGTKPLLAALHQAGERFDHALVGEPTSQETLGDVIKIGRRGSCNIAVSVRGTQGHVAYPEKGDNPVPVLLELLSSLSARKLDGARVDHFQPSNLEITTIDVGNPTHNVIPAKATAKLNIRFNTAHQGEDLMHWIQSQAEAVLQTRSFSGAIDLDIAVTGDAFLTPESDYTALLQTSVAAETGQYPSLSTGGGTSDARFIKDYAPVAELGLIGASIHQVNEHARLDDIEKLTRIYARILDGYFSA